MSVGPINRNAVLQTYNKIFIGGSPTGNEIFNFVQLAPATNSRVYESGMVLAKYTGGANAGKFVNFVPSAADGQGVPVCVLSWDYLTTAETTAGTGDLTVQVCSGIARLDKSTIFWTTPGNNDDLTTIFGIATDGSKIPAVFFGNMLRML